MNLLRVYARCRTELGYRLAQQLFRVSWCLRQPRLWRWMEGRFARQAAAGDAQAQAFYGHILLFRGQGLAAREEGVRLLRLAADAGQAGAAYQLGMQALQGNLQQAPDGPEACRRLEQALKAGHPLAAYQLARLFREGAPGLAADTDLAAEYARQAG
ncbi:sel1 repeat family protein [Pseudomonas sp. NW5]|uniref:sel1 repeat family protein n=1 Tax=Pseudomonas sp. NW5 TaxID=2934934 RepID=UPI0020202C32|nr:sel1 repeat family protein [Pseudomonas sp. NW5]MCL7462866.1 sel1 repeat family protein [Pseudomonas sp. NW5]